MNTIIWKTIFFKLQPYPFIIFMKSIKMSSWNRFLKVDIINNIKKVLEFEEIDLSHSHHPSVFDILSLTENFCQDQRCVLTEWSPFRVYFHFACFFLMLLTRTIKLCNVIWKTKTYVISGETGRVVNLKKQERIPSSQTHLWDFIQNFLTLPGNSQQMLSIKSSFALKFGMVIDNSLYSHIREVLNQLH